MSQYRGPGTQFTNTSQSPLDFTPEYKKISSNLSALLAPNLPESNRNDLVDEIFIVLHSTKSRELLLHLLQNAILFYIVQHPAIRDSIVKRTGYWQIQFLKMYMNDPLSADNLASILPISANNGGIHLSQDNGGSVIPLSSMARDLSAKFVHGVMDVDANSAMVMQQMAQGTESLVAAVKAASVVVESQQYARVSVSSTSGAPPGNASSGGGVSGTVSGEDNLEVACGMSTDDADPDTTTDSSAPPLLKPPSTSDTQVSVPAKPSRPALVPRNRSGAGAGGIPTSSHTGLYSEYHPNTTITAKRVPVMSLQPLATTSQQYWLVERQLTQVLSGVFSLLFYHCLNMYISFAPGNMSIDASRKVAVTFREITFDASLMALEELYGWEEHSVVILRTLLYTFMTTLTTKANDIMRDVSNTTTFVCCLAEIGNFIEEFVFFRPTGHQTYLSSVRLRSTFLSSLRLGEDMLAKCHRYPHSTPTEGSILPQLVPDNHHSNPQSIYIAHTSSTTSSSILSGSGRGDGSGGSGAADGGKDKKDHQWTRPFGFHFDANGAQDLPLVERYVYLLMQLGWAHAASHSTSFASKIAGKLTSSSAQTIQQHPCPSQVPLLYPKPHGFIPTVPVNERVKYHNNQQQQQQQQGGGGVEYSNTAAASKTIQEARRASGITGTSASASGQASTDIRRSSLPTESLSLSGHTSSTMHNMDTFRTSSSHIALDTLSFNVPSADQPHSTTTTTVGALGPSSFQLIPDLTPTTPQPTHRLTTPQIKQIPLDLVKKESREAYNALVKIMSRQFTFFSSVAVCLNNVFTLPTLPSTALNIPYSNTYTESLFKTATPPQHELLVSQILLDTVPSAFATNVLKAKYVTEAYLEGVPNPIVVEATPKALHTQQGEDDPDSAATASGLTPPPPPPPSLSRPYSASSMTASAVPDHTQQSHHGGRMTTSSTVTAATTTTGGAGGHTDFSPSMPSMRRLHADVSHHHHHHHTDPNTLTTSSSTTHLHVYSDPHSGATLDPSTSSATLLGSQHHAVVDTQNHIDTNSLVSTRPNKIYSHPYHTHGAGDPSHNTMVGGVPALAYQNPQYHINPLPGGGTRDLPHYAVEAQLVSDTAEMTPPGAVFSRGVAVNAGFTNVSSILTGSIATHDASHVTTSTTQSSRVHIGVLTASAISRERFQPFSKDLPNLLNDQLKILLTRRRMAFLGHSSLIMNEIYHTGDLKWRADVDTASVPTPGWAPLVIPSHHIPVAVSSSRNVYSHGVWTPVTIPTIHMAAGADPNVEDIIKHSVYGVAQQSLMASAQQVLMPMSMSVDFQSTTHRHLPSGTTAAFNHTKQSIDGYMAYQQQAMKQELSAYHQQLQQEHDAVVIARQQLAVKEREIREREIELARAQQQLQYQQHFGSNASAVAVLPQPALYNVYSHSISTNTASTVSHPGGGGGNPHGFNPSAVLSSSHRHHQQRINGGGEGAAIGRSLTTGPAPAIPQRPQRPAKVHHHHGHHGGGGRASHSPSPKMDPTTGTPKLPAKDAGKLSRLGKGSDTGSLSPMSSAEQKLNIPPPPPPFTSDRLSTSSSPTSASSPRSVMRRTTATDHEEAFMLNPPDSDEIATHVVGGSPLDGGDLEHPRRAGTKHHQLRSDGDLVDVPSEHIGGVLSIHDRDHDDHGDNAGTPPLNHRVPPIHVGNDAALHTSSDEEYDDDEVDIDLDGIPSSPPPPPQSSIPLECQTPVHLRHAHHQQRGAFARLESQIPQDTTPTLERFASKLESCDSDVTAGMYDVPSHAPENPVEDDSGYHTNTTAGRSSTATQHAFELFQQGDPETPRHLVKSSTNPQLSTHAALIASPSRYFNDNADGSDLGDDDMEFLNPGGDDDDGDDDSSEGSVYELSKNNHPHPQHAKTSTSKEFTLEDDDDSLQVTPNTLGAARAQRKRTRKHDVVNTSQ